MKKTFLIFATLTTMFSCQKKSEDPKPISQQRLEEPAPVRKPDSDSIYMDTLYSKYGKTTIGNFVYTVNGATAMINNLTNTDPVSYYNTISSDTSEKSHNYNTVDYSLSIKITSTDSLKVTVVPTLKQTGNVYTTSFNGWNTVNYLDGKYFKVISHIYITNTITNKNTLIDFYTIIKK